MEHTAKCTAYTLAIQRAIEHFAELHPHYCRTCLGEGALNYMEDVCGDGGPRMPMSDPCPDCTEIGKCPLCGQMTLDEDCEKCSNCKWTYLTNEICPEPYECYCWEEAYSEPL